MTAKRAREGLLSLLVSAFLLAAVLPAPCLAASTFSDISGHWAQAKIEQFAGKGYIKGFPDGTFRPDRKISRAEFVTILVACLGAKPVDDTRTYFSDVRKDYWALPQINEAVRLGILLPSEYPTGLAPDGPIYRSEAAAMMVRALGITPTYSTIPFKDSDAIARSMYRNHIATAYREGLMSGDSNGEFKPFASATRAEACTMLMSFLEKRGASPGSPTTPTAGNLTSVVVNGKSIDISSGRVVFRDPSGEVRADSLSASDGKVVVNNYYRYPLNSTVGNPDVVIGNTLYRVGLFVTSGNSLVIFPAARKLTRITVDGTEYSADAVELHIEDVGDDYLLSDAELVDEYTIRVDGLSYDLASNRITITAGYETYRIEMVNMDDIDISLELAGADEGRDGLDRSDILAIFDGRDPLDLDDISSLTFLIDGKRYDLSDVAIEEPGEFTVGDESYDRDEVILIADGDCYQIEEVDENSGKYIFFCREADLRGLVLVNDDYYDLNDVEILMDGDAYDLEDIEVIDRDELYIDGESYDLDSSFKCRINGKTYDIEEIDYDDDLNLVMIEIDEDEYRDDVEIEQPEEFLFYLDDELFYDGDLDEVIIEADGDWIDFEEIALTGPASFIYDGDSYDLIGALVEIDGDEFEIEDTAWYGRDGTFAIYLDD